MKPHDFKAENGTAICRRCRIKVQYDPKLPFHGGGRCPKRPELGDAVERVIASTGLAPKEKGCGGCNRRVAGLNMIHRGVSDLVNSFKKEAPDDT